MVPSYVILEKHIGQTPLQAIEAWKHAYPAYASLPASYAGRLDPMASGKLLVLIGEECKNQERYRGLDKEYEIEVLLDLSSDTGDVLGLPTYAGTVTEPGESIIKKALKAVTGAVVVPYPAFSSKTVDGKPLFHYALMGMLDSITLPIHQETIYRVEYLGMRRVEGVFLQKEVMEILSHAPRTDELSKALGADFRQDEIRSSWQELLPRLSDQEFTLLKLRVSCASGTYMRTLAERIGNHLGTRGMALSIRRTRIGRYHNLPFWGLWSRRY